MKCGKPTPTGPCRRPASNGSCGVRHGTGVFAQPTSEALAVAAAADESYGRTSVGHESDEQGWHWATIETLDDLEGDVWAAASILEHRRDRGDDPEWATSHGVTRGMRAIGRLQSEIPICRRRDRAILGYMSAEAPRSHARMFDVISEFDDGNSAREHWRHPEGAVGGCSVAAWQFTSEAKDAGLDAETVKFTGLDPTKLPDDSEVKAAWGDDAAAISHEATVVTVDGEPVVVDFTARQFDNFLGFPHVEDLDDYQSRFGFSSG